MAFGKKKKEAQKKNKMSAKQIENAMNNLRNATSTTFDDAKIKVQEEISQLKIRV